jgi:hypothetical protein
MTDDKPTLEDPRVIMVLAAAKPGGRHSPLYRWMMENHATLAAEFAMNGPQWATRVPAMGEVGLLDAAGQRPSPRTAMQTWYRVCRALRTTSPQDKAIPTPAALPRSPPTTAVVEETRSPPEFGLKFSGGFKDWTKKPD